MAPDPGKENGASSGSRTPAEPLSGAEYGGVAFQFIGAILVFLYLGKWLDAKFGTAPWFLMIGVFGGAGAGFYAMYRKLMRQFPAEPKGK